MSRDPDCMEPESIESAVTETVAGEARMDPDLVRRIIEAALLAAQRPLSLAQMAELFPEDAPAPADAIAQAIEALRTDCTGRGVELVEVASGFRYQVRNEM